MRVKDFNQILNTQRAKKMLAILARSGQFLPVCLTFGPTNGPEDLAYATDRVYSPGRGRKMRLCKEWEIYADDCTIRTGRYLDGLYYTDAEHAARVKEATKKSREPMQELDAAFEALGFNPAGLGQDKKGKPAAEAKSKAKAKARPKSNQ